MNLTTVEKLLEAGFTAAEIREMSEKPAEEDKQPEQEPKEQPKEEPEKEKEADQQTAPEPSETETRLNSIEQSLKGLLKAFQTANVNRDTQQAPNTQSMQSLTDAAMASLIRGSTKPKEEKQ